TGDHLLRQLIRERPGEVVLRRRAEVPNIATYAEPFVGKRHRASADVPSEHPILVAVRGTVGAQDISGRLHVADTTGPVRHELAVGADRVGPDGVGHIGDHVRVAGDERTRDVEVGCIVEEELRTDVASPEVADLAAPGGAAVIRIADETLSLGVPPPTDKSRCQPMTDCGPDVGWLRG